MPTPDPSIEPIEASFELVPADVGAARRTFLLVSSRARVGLAAVMLVIGRALRGSQGRQTWHLGPEGLSCRVSGTDATAAPTRLVSCLAVAAVSVALASCGGEAQPTGDEVDTAYLRVAKRARAYTFTIDRATEAPPDRPKQLAREFRSFAGDVEYTAKFFLTNEEVGPVQSKAFVLAHSLSIYEFVLRSVAKLARDPGNGRTLERLFRDVRGAGADVRIAGAALERALRAAIAD